MAGILQYLIDRADRQSNAEKYGNLLGTYMEPKAGPVQEGVTPMPGEVGGPLLQAPPERFFAQAAAIPGYEVLAQGAQSNAGAMNRQMQAQQWEQNNLTKAQQAQLAANKATSEWQQNFQMFQHQNPSAYQTQSLQQGADQFRQSNALGWANYGINQRQQQLAEQTALTKQMNPFASLDPAKQQTVLQEYAPLQNGVNAIADIQERVKRSATGGKAFQALSGEAAAMQDQYRAALAPIVFKMFKPAGDAPNEREAKQMEEFIGDVTSLTSTSATKQKRLEMMSKFIEQQAQPYQMTWGFKPLQAQYDQSPFAKAYPSGATGKESDLVGVRPWRPSANKPMGMP
jgi:hypothetical protein